MARQKRAVSASGRYHILLRGMNKLFHTQQDYEEFSGILRKYSQSGHMRILAYVLLSNRIHLIIDTFGADAGITLKPICTSYARCYNRVHSSGGKLFYDRFKSEPLESADELKSAVGFINFIASQNGEDYPFCSMRSDICDISGTGLTDADFRSEQVTQMFIEDYDCLSAKELGRYIYELCGIFPADFKTLTSAQQQAVFERIMKKRWISKSKLYEIFSMGRRIQIKNDESPDDIPKKDLSVWLL